MGSKSANGSMPILRFAALTGHKWLNYLCAHELRNPGEKSNLYNFTKFGLPWITADARSYLMCCDIETKVLTPGYWEIA